MARRRTGTAVRALVLLAILATAGLTFFFFPHSSSAQVGSSACPGSAGRGYAFETYEAARTRVPYLQAQQLAATNELLPTHPTFRLPSLKVGPAGLRSALPETIPAPLLHAIGWVESSLNQAAINVTYESIGPSLVSFDCGYGIMQITSFFSNDGDTPSRSEALIGAHYAYNIAMGAVILAEKWNADEFPVVGLSDPSFLESWYYALWSYNGFAFSNHPAGSETNPFRQTPYACAGPRNGIPYQELVYGCTVNPPRVDGIPLWSSTAVQLPNLATLAQPGGALHPDAFFNGWSLIFTAPLTGQSVSRPFAQMDLALPQTARPVATLAAGGTAAAQRATILGAPSMRVDRTTMELRVTDDSVEQGSFTITNNGTGLLPYRIVFDEGWLEFSAVAGVAAGSDVVIQAGKSRTATVRVTPTGEGLAEGFHQGTIMVEALLPSGAVQTSAIVVQLDKHGVPRYEAGSPQS